MSAAGAIRKAVLVVAAAAIVCSGAVTACSEKQPAQTTPSTNAPNIAPTEKAGCKPHCVGN